MKYPRLPARVFDVLMKFLLYETGRWTKFEEEKILDHLSENQGSYDLDKLKNIVKRPRIEIKQCIERLQSNSEVVKKKGKPFTVEEQMEILKCAMAERPMPKTFEEF